MASRISGASTGCSTKATGWKIVAVQGLVPDEVFFDHLANRRFPVTWWIRRPEQMDYIAEPDLFHDLFGHVPLLHESDVRRLHAGLWPGGVKALGLGAERWHNLTRLYWYTVEFGLIRTADGPAHLRLGHRLVEGRVDLLPGESPRRTESASICCASCARAIASTRTRRPISSSTASSS